MKNLSIIEPNALNSKEIIFWKIIILLRENLFIYFLKTYQTTFVIIIYSAFGLQIRTGWFHDIERDGSMISKSHCKVCDICPIKGRKTIND